MKPRVASVVEVRDVGIPDLNGRKGRVTKISKVTGTVVVLLWGSKVPYAFGPSDLRVLS